jgi:predicted lipoprotein with Yx(FWY)xxD motif
MRRMMLTLVALLFTTSLAAQAQNATAPAAVKVMKMGDSSMLTNDKGMTLYVYDADTGGKATCTGGCASAWPPLAATSSDKPVGKFTIVTRDDGSLQWAYSGKPLYTWRNDKAPGDMTGDGVGGKWHVAKQ